MGVSVSAGPLVKITLRRRVFVRRPNRTRRAFVPGPDGTHRASPSVAICRRS